VQPISEDMSVSVGDRPRFVPPLATGSSITLSTSLAIISALEWLLEEPSNFICTTFSLISKTSIKNFLIF
jgi:hypothetical protein